MNDKIKQLYDVVGQEYDLGTYDEFKARLQQDDSRKKFYDVVGQEYDLGDYGSFSSIVTSYPDSASPAPSAPSEEVAEEMQPKDETRFGILGKMGQYMGSPSAYVPMLQAEEREELTQAEIDQRAAMRQMLQESGTIDRMEEMEKEARKNKFKAFGEALAYTPQVSSFGVASNIYDSTEEQLADAQRALEASEEHRQNKAMEQTLDVALDKARAGEWGGIGENNVGNGVVDFGLGLWDSATRMSTWDFGVSDTLNGLTIAQVVKKWEEDPESLTATERNLLDAMGMATAVQEAYQDQVGIGYAVGESLPVSAGFMASMYLNPASGLGKSLARQAVKKYGRQSIAKNLARIGGDIAETAIMTATTGGGRVVADAFNRINGQSTYEIDPETGIVMYGGQEDQKTVGEAVVKAIGSNFIENYSEALGEYFDPLLGMSRRLAAGGLRKMNLDKWADALSDVEPSQMAASIRSLREKAKFGGVFGEIMEEEVGMALNAITVGDYTFSKEEADASNGKKQWIFDLENQLTAALSCAIMSGAITGVETIGNVRYRRDMERDVADAEKAARAAVGDEMIEQIDQASPEGMVDILRDAYVDQNLSLQQKRVLAEYATQRVRMQYYNAADAKARRQVNVTRQNTIDAYEAGRHAQLPQYYNIDQEYRRSEAAINERENAEEIWDAIRLMNNMDENERQNIMRDFSEEDQELIRNWRYNAYRWQGAVNHRAEQVEDLVDEYAGQVNPYTRPDGTITTAILGDDVVYVMNEAENGDAVVYTNDGRKIFCKMRDLEHVQQHNAEELIERFRQQTTEVVNQETEKNLNYPSEVFEPAVNVEVQTADGKTWLVTAVNGDDVQVSEMVLDRKSNTWNPNGAPKNMTRTEFMDWQKAELDRKKANTYEQGDELTFYVNGDPISAEITGIDPEGNYYVQISHLTDGLDKAVSDVYTAEELRKLTTPSSKVSEKTTENESTPSEEIKQSVSEEVTNSQIEDNVTEPTAEVAESVNTALSHVPKDAKGNPLYEQTDADTAWDAIMEQTEGDAEMAQRVAADMLEDKKAALAKMQKGKPKKGATVAEKIANEKAHIAAIAQAEQEVAAWERIANTEARRREAAMSEADRYAAEMKQKNISEGLAALGEAQSLEEYVLAQLAGGAYKLRWNDKENGTKGFGSHTGLSTEEMMARLSIIDNKNGLTPEEIAHSIVENMDASFGEVDVMDVTDMVIDAVSTYASRRAMINGMVESRAELIRQQEIAEQEAKDAWYMEQYHATEEELAAYSEYLSEITEEIIADDANYEERFNTFAELIADEYDNQGTDADIRSSADQGERLASDREGSSSVGEGEEADRQGAVLGDAPRFTEAEDGRAGSSVSAESDVDAERDYREHLSSVIYEIESELGALTADNAEKYVKSLFDNFKWQTLEEADDALRQIFKLQDGKVNSLAILPYLDAAQKEARKLSHGLKTDRKALSNGDVVVTNYDSNGKLSAVTIERDGEVVSVGTYEDGVLFERTDYDANGNATKVTRYKDGEVVSEHEYKDGKRKVTANVFEMAEEAQKNRKAKKNKDDTTRRGIQESPAEADRVSGEIFGGESLGEGESVSARSDGGILEEGAGKKKRTAKARRQSDNRQEARDGKAERLSRGISSVQQQAIDEHTRTNPWDANLTDDERGVLNMYRMATINELDELAHKLADKINSGKATPRDRMRYDVLAAYAKSGELKAVADAMGVEYGKPVSLDTIKSLFETFNSDADLAKLFDRVFPLVKKINPTIIYRRFTEADIEEGEDVLPDDILGQYSLQENLIEYNRNQIDSNHCTEQEKASTIVHEMIHAVARYAIRVQEAHNKGVKLDIQLPKRLLDAAQSLIEVYDAIKDNEIFNDDRYESGKMYGVSSVHEMLSELADPEFREKLKQVSIENLPSDKRGLVRDALRAIKDFIHRMFGWDSSSAYVRTKRALDKLIDNYDSAGYNKAREVADDDFAQQRTYHGSGALFDKFDHSFMGTGEGNQSFGWGTYVSESEGVGKTYVEISAKPALSYKGQEVDTEGLENPWRIIGDLYEDTRGKLSEMRAKAERYERLAEDDSPFKPIWGEVVAILKKARRGDIKVAPRRMLYSVEIPDNNGSNYLEWYENVPKKVLSAAKEKLYKLLVEGDYKGAERELKRELDDLFALEQTGQNLYGNISAYLGSNKEASQFLHEMGYVGIKYPTNTLHGGNIDGTNNYVIFDENDLEIVDNIRFRDGAPFFSNAERAVENIKQQKATPEQWLAMIKKDGGLKAGEDKWMGLSDWLNEQKEKGVKTLTKDEVLQFIRENQIEIEEVEYGGNPVGFDELKEEYEAMLHDEGYDAAHDAMIDRFGDDFDIAFEDLGGELVIANEEAAAALLRSENIINPTRLDYTTEGLNNKREIALVVPTIEPWNQTDTIHFGDAGEGRAVAWVRFGETTDEDGNRVLVIDEVQSKRHDEGRANGYSKHTKREEFRRLVDEMYDKYGANFHVKMTRDEEIEFDRLTNERIREDENNNSAVPDAPFDKNYHELAMKRMLRYAAENGFDKVAWNTGKQVAQRFGLSNRVSSIEYKPLANGHYHITAYGTNGYPIEGVPVVYNNEQEIAETFGRGIAEKIVNDIEESKKTLKEANDALRELKERKKGLDEDSEEYEEIMEEYAKLFALQDEANSAKSIEGDGLSIGGDDRVALYDEMIPRFMNKYTKKWGAKVGEVTLPEVEEAGRTMWSVDVTPEMRESVMQGQPMFREGMGAISDREVSYENDPIAKWQGKPRYYGKRAAAFAERERRRMQKGVEKAANILGIEVEIITDASTLKGRKAKAKGWYDINSKKVVVVVPNHVSKGDAVRTVLHEGVAHHGLRELFGDGFDAMLDNIYNNVAPELKARIDAIAERTGVDTRVATEEYLASLAEETNFKEAQKMGWWAKIWNYFVKMLNKLGMPGLILKEELTDNELRYLLWRSYQNLVDPNSFLKPLGYLDDVAKQKELKVGEYAENTMATPRAAEMSMASEDAIRYRLVDDQAEIDRLESEPTIKAYRAMQVINGELYPPMSAVVDGKLREPIALGQWERSEEQPELADDNGRFKLDKGNKKSLKAAYNPYFHSSSTPLNDQFSEAQDRDNLVTVEVEVPVSEADGTSGYKAEKAKDAVGTHQWKAGIIQGQLTGTREVFLTRWDKPIRIVPESEVADVIVEMFDGKDIVMPSNVVTPQLRKELEARGITFVETDNQGKLVEGEHKGKHYSKVYGKKTGGLRYREGDDTRLMDALADAYASGDKKAIQNAVNDIIDAMRLEDADPSIGNLDWEKVEDYEGSNPRLLAAQYIVRAKHHLYLDEDYDTEYIKTGIKTVDAPINEVAEGDVNRYTNDFKNERTEAQRQFEKQVEESQKSHTKGTWLWNGLMSAEDIRERHQKMLEEFDGLLSEYQFDKAAEKLGEIRAWQNAAKKYIDAPYNEIPYVGEEVLIAEIEREAAALGVPVRIVRSVDELPDEDTRKRAVDGQLKGYFDPRTGEVALYEPNTDNANDAKRTVLHETVGHKGLRQLIGEQRYDKAMVQLMYMLPSEVRDAVLRRAERHGWNAAIAMDEYLADQAERDVQPTWWGKVNAKIRALLRNIGFNVKLTDADVTYLLWRSRKKLMGDTAFDMATNAILKQAARKSAKADAWNEQAFKDAEMRDFEKGAMQRLRNRIGDAQNEYDSAMKSMAFKQRESWQDSTLSIKVFMDILEKESGKKIADWENAYMYENAMSSANLMEMQMFRHDVYGRLLKAVHELMESGAKYEEIVDYMMAKHGLERNEKMARAEAEEKVEKWKEKAVEEMLAKAAEELEKQNQRNAVIEARAKSAYKVKKQRLKGQLERGTISEAQYDHYMQVAEEAYQNELATMKTTHPVDVIAEIEKINTKAEQKLNEYWAKHRDYSGLTALTGKDGVAGAESAAMQMIADFEAKHNTDLLWNETRACTQTILNISHDAGILSDKVYDELWNQYEYYIPLRGFDETTAEEVYTYVGDNKSPYNAPIKTAKGRKSKADDPIATIATMAESAIVEANRNRLKQRFLYMVERHRTELASVNSVWVEKNPITGDCVTRFANIPNDATPEEAAQAQKAFEERMEQLHEQEPERYYKASEKPNIPYRVEKKANEHEHQVIVKRGGKDVVIVINGNTRVAQAINGLTNPEAVKGFSKFAGNVNRFLSANFTTRNPAFVVSNFVRDGFYTNSMVWAKEGRAYAWKYNQNWVKATKLLPSLVSKYKRYEKGDKSALDMSDPVERAFYEFMINGGETGYTVINSVEDYKGIVAGDLKTMQGGVVGNTKKAVQAVGNALDTFGRWAEDTSRFAAFLTSREMGRSVTKSIWDAKEISVNFNKKGSGRKMTQHDKGLNSILGWMSQRGRDLYVFWNAGMQGMFNFGKAVKEHPGKMAGLAGVYFGLGMAMAAIFGGHDDDDEDYWNLPEYVRRNNICFRVGNKFVTLPLPIELRAIYGMGELAMSWMAGKEDPKKVGMKVVQQMSQVMPIDMMAEGGGLMAFVPSWAKPIVEVVVNTDWTGMPIYRDRTPWNEYDPQWMLAFKSTSPELVAASRAINEATNKNLPSGKENKYDRGWADIEYLNNPAAWEHVVEGYLGGLATMFNQTKKSVMALWNKDLREVRNIPVVSRFLKDAGEKSKEYALREDYFNAKGVVDELRSQRGHFRKESIDPSLTEEQRKDVMESRIEMEKMVNATISQWNSLENARKKLEDMVKDNPDQEVTFDGKKGNAKDALDEVTRRMVKLTEGYQ